MAPNHFDLAWSADKVGAMRNQVYVMGRFDLNPGEAFVVDVSDGGAEYFTVPLSNIWGTTLDIVDRTGSLNKAQSTPNDDGTYTYVISPTDPGVANWIDSDGLLEGILTLRIWPSSRQRTTRGSRRRAGGSWRSTTSSRRPGLRQVSESERAVELAARRSRIPAAAARRDMTIADWWSPGAQPGIGREIACAALEAGHSVRPPPATALRRGPRRRIGDHGPGTSPRRHRPRPDHRGRRATEAAFGGIDVLVNNAGYGYMAAVEEGTDAEVRKLFDTNYFGVVDTLKAVLPGMRARRSGTSSTISSMTGLVANPPNATTRRRSSPSRRSPRLSKEVAPLGIKVTAIEPGAFRTDGLPTMQESSTP